MRWATRLRESLLELVACLPTGIPKPGKVQFGPAVGGLEFGPFLMRIQLLPNPSSSHHGKLPTICFSMEGGFWRPACQFVRCEAAHFSHTSAGWPGIFDSFVAQGDPRYFTKSSPRDSLDLFPGQVQNRGNFYTAGSSHKSRDCRSTV